MTGDGKGGDRNEDMEVVDTPPPFIREREAPVAG